MARPIRRGVASANVSSRLAGMILARREGTPSSAPVRRRVRPDAAPLGPPVIPEDAKVLSDILARARYAPRAARSGAYLHVSDLIGKCIRRIAIVQKHNIKPPPQRLSLMDSLTFDVGDTIHDVIKSRMASGSPDQVWGNWRCACRQTKTQTPSTYSEIASAVCPTCRGPLDIYEEVPMRDEELRIVGTPDLLMFLAEVQAFYVSELKSIAHAQWVELVRPKPEHVIQVLFYWYLMSKLGYRLVDRVSILYVTKGYLFVGDPYKEFTFVPSEIIGRLEPYLEEARALIVSRETGVLPPRIQCASDRAPDAKKCDVCSICFGGSNAIATPVSIAAALGTRRR